MEWWRIQGWPTADEWQAIWGLLTLGVAVAAAWIALTQLHGASLQLGQARDQLSLTRELRIDELKPYVLVYLRPSEHSGDFLAELVIVNTGATAAFDVHLMSDPPLMQISPPRGWDINNSELMKRGIRVLPPNAPIRANFDVFNLRVTAIKAGTAPQTHAVSAMYKDRLGNIYTDIYDLDLLALDGLVWSTRKPARH